MSEWRPDDWDAEKILLSHNMKNTLFSHRYAVDIGADAMYEACRKNWRDLIPQEYVCILQTDFNLSTGVKRKG